ncbi:MAG: hypothetical protein CVT48_06295 [Thermoplasmata archaeon HGW-Thermoplasmata-1]|nr:MAG: hypothetical protein CVT48_06295 [Thermoplasmata archaeon HGW-Thermoplasmata-1]
MKQESESVEFKPSLAQNRDIVESVSAFSNTSGGRIIIGRSDDGEVLGADIGKRTLENLANQIKQNTDPPVFPSITIEDVESKSIIVVEVSESSAKPVLACGRAFKRVGRSNQKMGYEEIRKLAMHSSKVYWDGQICEGTALEDIDKEKVKWFLRKAKEERNFDVDPEAPTKEALERLNVLKNEKLTNAAVLLFGKNPQKFFLQAKIRCARFKGVDGLDYIDMKILEGTIPELRENAIKFIMQHTKHGVFFDENRRYDRWEYPFRALEELLSNALAHREYESTSDMQVSIYDNRIEIWNPGELPEPLTPADLKKKHKSIPRNRLIAETLFLIKYIEQWGRGTNRVIKELLAHKLPEPRFQTLSGGFEVIVYGPGKEFEEEIEREKYHILDINERQKKAIKYLKEHSRIDRKTYCNLCNVGKTVAHEELSDLKNKKIITMANKGRSSYYTLL